jgi:hypothetical protein
VVLAAKLLLAPSFVMAASLAARRFGAKVGGLLGGLPVVAGPILLVFALSHGRAFAAQAATATLLGIVSLCAFILVYARLAGRWRWLFSLLAGWLSFLAVGALFSVVSVGAGLALALACGALVATLLALPAVEGHGGETPTPPPPWDLPLRGLSALALVLAITAVAGSLGPKLSGLLTPFPVVATVLAVFTHVQHGERHLVRIMRGFSAGLFGYVLFCFVLAVSLRSAGVATSFLIALASALGAQALAMALHLRPARAAAATD